MWALRTRVDIYICPYNTCIYIYICTYKALIPSTP